MNNLKNQTERTFTIQKLGTIDPLVFYPSIIGVLLMLLAIVFLPEQTNNVLGVFKNFITVHFTWFIMFLVATNFLVVIWIAFGKYAHVVLGATSDEKPEFTTLSWIAMLFSAGVGIGFITFGVAEPLWHLYTSSHTLNANTAGSPAGVPMAVQISISNWGASCWALFALGGLAIALPAYKKNLPMCVSTGLYGILGDKVLTSPFAKLADICGILASIAGNATALGIGVLTLGGLIARVFDVEITTLLRLILMLSIIGIYIICTVSGLKRGIKYMSNLNIILAALLCAFVLLVGPTTYILNLFTEVTGLYVREFVNMNFFTDAGSLIPRDWLYWWPVFYWLWWISYIPFVGGFVARISKGRTLREYMLGVAIIPVAFSVIWFTVFGGAGSFEEFSGNIKLWDIVQNQGSEFSFYTLLEAYPLSSITILLAAINLLTFAITTSNSAAFFLGMQASGGDMNPSKNSLIFWGSMLGSIGVGVAIIGGTAAMNALNALTIAGAAPFCIILLLYIISVIKMLRAIDKGTL